MMRNAPTQTAAKPTRVSHWRRHRTGTIRITGTSLVSEASPIAEPATNGEKRNRQVRAKPANQIGVSWNSDQAAGGQSSVTAAANKLQRPRPNASHARTSRPAMAVIQQA